MTSLIRPAFESTDLHTDESPKGLRVTCVTGNSQYTHSNIYMEAPVFTPDSRRFVFQRVYTASDGLNERFRQRQYWLCDLDDGCSLRPLTDERHAIAPGVTPDGKYMYYFVQNPDPTKPVGIRLKRVDLETFKDETVMVIDKPLGGIGLPSQLYVLSSIRGDGDAVAFGAFFGDGRTADPMWGVAVCDIKRGDAQLVYHNTQILNPHMQYTRTADPVRKHDLLIQQNVNVICKADGSIDSLGKGCTLLVIADDGSNFRRVPCGHLPHEMVHGHQEWRGDKDTVIVGVDHFEPDGRHTRPVFEAKPIATDPSDQSPPATMPGADANRNEITRDLPNPLLGHTAIDPTGTKFITDNRDLDGPPEPTRLWIGTLDDQPGAALRMRCLLDPRSTYTNDQNTHPHPTLSPDGKIALFNTDHTGSPQVWMADGFDYPA